MEQMIFPDIGIGKKQPEQGKQERGYRKASSTYTFN
jgi:hypothetical protein